MAEEKPIVKALGYIGGQDEDLGGYCEPLIIRVNGNEHYVLHEMHTYRTADRTVNAEHNKVEFDSLEILISEFDKVKAKLTLDKSLPWTKTDSNCGYDIPEEEWEKAYARRFSK